MHALTGEFLDALRAAVGAAHVATGEAVALLDVGWNPHNLDAGVVVSPASTQEVAAVVRLCNQHGVPLVPQAGRTGLVGGSISHTGEIVLSLLRLNHVEAIDPQERVAVVGAGCTLQALQDAAAVHQLEPGIDLAARGSATLGGMVSTNAGGVMAFRNGVMRHRVLGLEAVLPDGSVFQDLTRVVKNSAGYDLKHLFIGAEGTLGVVTRVVVKLDPLPQATATALFGLPSVDATLDVIALALQAKAGHLRAAEALWRGFMQLNAQALHWSQEGFSLDQPIFLLLKLGGADEAALQAAFEQLFETTLARYPSSTGIIASSQRQETALWHLREDTDIVYRAYPQAPSYDVSVPLSRIPAYVAQVQAELVALDATLQPFIFGHLADGNLHIILNVRGPVAPERAQAVEHILYRHLQALGGSFSAEHGVGSKRIGAMNDTTDATKLSVMAQVKRLLDPQGLMNPGKVFQA
ncbi:MAG: FAD-binding oxidoreductase [Betaproteobacteria bacterium]